LKGFELSLGAEKGIPDFLEKDQMVAFALCKLSLLASVEKEGLGDLGNKEVKR